MDIFLLNVLQYATGSSEDEAQKCTQVITPIDPTNKNHGNQIIYIVIIMQLALRASTPYQRL